MRPLLVLCALLLTACVASPPQHFYRLDAMAAPAGSPTAQSLRVAIGRVDVPALIDRSQIVELTGNNEVLINESQRWAEPIAQAIGRVLASDLAAHLGSPLVWVYPQEPPADVQYRVDVTVQRLDMRADSVELAAIWSVRGVAVTSPLQHYTATIRQTRNAASTDEAVAADNRVLDELAARIAKSLAPK